MSNVKKKLVSIIASITLISSIVVTSLPIKITKAATNSEKSVDVGASEEAEKKYNLPSNVKDGAILHAWCWSFKTLKENMKSIAESGYTAVQTIPINNILERDTTMRINGGDDSNGKGGIWWFHYQPTDWKIGNYQVGTEEEFKEMCNEAYKYGVKVIVDVVPNHTTTDKGWISRSFIDTVGGEDKMYHAYNQKIGNYNDRYQCTLGKASGCLDMNTENPKYQDYFIKYLNKCIEDGADGFRFDTAKHIGLPSDPVDDATRNNGWTNNFWPRIIKEVNHSSEIFNYLEVLNDSYVKEREYSEYGSVTASDYGENVRNKVGAKDIAVNSILTYNPKQRYNAAPSKSLTWVESHDTYSDNSSSWLNDWQIKMGWAIITAREEGTPLFFDRPDGATGEGNKWGKNVIGPKGSDLFKDKEVVAVNKFRNAMVGQKENLMNINGNNKVLAIQRGNKGVVIVNLGEDCKIENHKINLIDGTYIDKVSGGTFQVSGGKLTGVAKGGKVTVLYDAPDPQPIASVSCDTKSKSFKGDSLTVTLNCSNVSKATYSINNGSEIVYSNGTKLELGKDIEPGESVKLKLVGYSNDGEKVTESYEYKKVDSNVKEGYLYVTKPSGWGDMYAYIYDDSTTTVKKLEAWPGVKMQKEGDQYYYELPSEWQTNTTRVIFNDRNNQLPKSQQPGELFKKGKAMVFEDGSISLVEPTKKNDLKIDDNAILVSNNNPYVGDKVTIKCKEATGGKGTIKYRFKVNGSVIKDYSTSRSVQWSPTKAGTYNIGLTVKDNNNEINQNIKVVVKAKNIAKINKISTSVSNSAVVGTSIKLTINATNAKSYGFISVCNGKTSTIRKYSSSNTATWTPQKAGTYTLYFKIKDSEGKIIYKTMKFKVYNKLAISSIEVSSKTEIQVRDNVSIKVNATGASRYKISVFDSNNKETILQNYKNNNNITWRPTAAGTYKICARITNSTGKIVTKNLSVVVNERKIIKINSVSTSIKSPTTTGKNVNITAKATSSANSRISYQFYVHEGVQGWKLLKNFSTTNTVTWKTKIKGINYIMVVAKDGSGNMEYKIVEFTIK